MTKHIVSKFGGTSMGDAACMLRSAEVAVDKNATVVVVSATSGTTNLLLKMGSLAEKNVWVEAEAILNELKQKHLKISADLNCSAEQKTQLEILFDEMESLAKGVFLLKDLSPKASDALVSLGERMSSVLFTQAMNQKLAAAGKKSKAILLDARKVIRTDDSFQKARALIPEIAGLAKLEILSHNFNEVVMVTQGFIGSTAEGATTTLGRGGSDYSAALFAEAVHADILEIWTDVAGISTTDPRLVPNAKPINEISVKEASELATFGAKVLHPATLLPAIRKNIPVFVGSSFDPKAGGTWVRKDVTEAPLVRAMALRKNQILVTLSTPEMLQAHGFLFKIFKVFNDHKVGIDAITTSEISVSVTLDDSTLMNKKLIQDLEQIAEVTVEDKLTLVSLIGNNINHTPGLGKQIFESIADINVRMICLGASKHNFCFLVEDAKGAEALQRLHQRFIG